MALCQHTSRDLMLQCIGNVAFLEEDYKNKEETNRVGMVAVLLPIFLMMTNKQPDSIFFH